MMKIKGIAEKFIKWKINSGDTNLWWDTWVGTAPLAHPIPNQSASSKDKVKDIMEDGNWNLQEIDDILPQDLLEAIKSVQIGNSWQEDLALWTPSQDGDFSTRSAISIMKAQRSINRFLGHCWHRNIPFKISFLLWRLVQKKLPFDDVIEQRFGFKITSRCVCCKERKVETLNHVFLQSEVAVNMWKHFGGPLGIIVNIATMENALWSWWNRKPKNDIHKLIMHITPIVICWEIWRERCACKYGEKRRIWIRGLERQITTTIKQAIHKAYAKINLDGSWAEICDRIEKMRHKQITQIVKWEMPPPGMVKINTDGSFSNRKAGAGGIIRDGHGKLIAAFSIPLTCSSNNQAEAQAVRAGLLACMQHGIKDCVLELDSLMIIDMLRNGRTTNITLKPIIEEILSISNQLNCSFSHCFREANSVADSLAKEAVGKSEPAHYSNLVALSSKAKSYFELDKSQMPSIRIRYEKSNFFVS